MNFPLRKLAIVSAWLVLTMAVLSFAQTNGNTPARPKKNSPPHGGIMGSFVAPGSGVHTIAGKPFTVEEESELSQVLGDGTHVSETTHFHIYRDSQGRTRNELLSGQLLEENRPPAIVQISDPVARVRYVLDLRTQVAHRYVLPVAGEHRPRIEPPAENAEQQPPPRFERARISATSEPGDESGQPQVSHASLGKQTFEGIEARGLQTITTIPVGAAGNDRPIEIVCENWESWELRLMMLSKCTDPLHGDHTRRVVSIDRSEPDPSLFQVPPGFKIEDPQNLAATDAAVDTER